MRSAARQPATEQSAATERPAATEQPDSEPIRWCSAAPQMTLNPGETHLWFTDLERTAQDETVNFLLTLLDDQERARALRFRRLPLMARFVAAHGQLRRVLGRYLAMAPQAVQFCYGDRGKPALAQNASAGGADGACQTALLQFNLSHSDRHALIAVGHHPVGVDLERLQPFPSAFSLAKRFFSAQEFEYLQELHDSEEDWARSRAFLRHWVCKEAYVKATGEGLVNQLHQVVVGFTPRAEFHQLPPEAESRRPLPPETPLASGFSLPWQVHEFQPSPDSLAAVVIPRDVPTRFSYWKI